MNLIRKHILFPEITSVMFFFFLRKSKLLSDQLILPRSVATTLQVSRDLGMRSDTVEEGHHFRVAAEHRLVLPEHILHTTVEHHITPHHLK